MAHKTIATPPGQESLQVELTPEELLARQAEEAAAIAKKEANMYKYLRIEEYPTIEEQLDMLYHGSLTSWRAEIKKIKDKYPKPE